MKTESLIADLAERAAVIRPLPPPWRRTLSWLAVALACAAAGIAAFGFRYNLQSVIAQPGFVTTAIAAVLVVIVGAAAALVLGVPGATDADLLRRTTLVLIAAWAAVLVAGIVGAGHGFSSASDWPICFARVMLIGLVPGVVLVAMLRRAAPLRPKWTAALALAAAMALGAFAIQFICPVTDRAHALLGHFGPTVALAIVGAWQGARWLKREVAKSSLRP